ncbi:MAG TPA: nucleotide exchange factor GrpE [Bacillota bacterium]|nr:nucleotide exchange factor GrpE [Bacillota bacterium]HPJ23551.1 nucleotide exchange factor GrpE [Bacillota bacterium]
MGEDKDKILGAEQDEAQEEVIENKSGETETKPEEEKAQDKKEKTKKKKKPNTEELLLEIQDELTELKDKYFRSLAETENYKKRLNEDLKRERKYAGYALANRLIDSIEVFNQALNMETNDPNLKNFLYGFRMIDEMIFNAMKEEGVALIETKVGETFDPNFQQAMDISYDPEKPENTILKVVKKGYMFKDRILRPSMVIINIKPEASESSDESEAKA